MKTICLLRDEATQPTQLLRNALPAKFPVRESESCRRLQLRSLGSSVCRAVSSALLNRHRSFRFQCARRNEVKHGIPDCI